MTARVRPTALAGIALALALGCAAGPILDLGDDLATGSTGVESDGGLRTDAGGGPTSMDDPMDAAPPTGNEAGGDAQIADGGDGQDGDDEHDASEDGGCEEGDCNTCESDRDCQESSEERFCGVAQICVECLRDADCRGDKRYCDTAEECVECLSDDDCGAGGVCEDGECE